MKLILPIACVVMLSSAVASLGQKPDGSQPSSAPIAWTEYRISSRRVSVSFPKLPVVRETKDLCAQSKGEVYHAYAAGAVYEFEWHTKGGDSIPDRCPTKDKFSQGTFTKRLSDLKAANKDAVESEATVAGSPASVLRWETRGGISKTRWLVWDKDRWFELAITRRGQTVVDEERFVNSFKISNAAGIKIGSGADATLGDAGVDLKDDIVATKRDGLVIVTKPRPGYTDAARANHAQGRVILRVTFYRNGGIGGITVVEALSHGLTEQAIAAAKKIAFLPGTADGNPYNVTKQIEYSFRIY